ESLLPLRPAEGVVAPCLADHARAGAVAAIGRAEAGGENQHAVGVAMHQPRNNAMAILSKRIVGLARRLEVLGADRNVGAAQRLQRVLARHQTRIVRRDAERERALVPAAGGPSIYENYEDALELSERAHPRTGLPAPVVPLRKL